MVPFRALLVYKSQAQSMLLIGCSGSGKTTSLERTLQTYPQVIYHPEFNFEQVVYLKVDCSHNGSLKEIPDYHHDSALQDYT